MGILDKFLKKPVIVTLAPPVVAESVESPKPKKPRAKRGPKQAAPSASVAKDAATARGEPYVAVLNVELDPANVGNGAFELDWNDIFLAKLIRAGYKGKNDQQIVDQWFQEVCRNVLMENFEQFEANNPRGVDRKDLGDGRAEIG
jgi:hypothetical protein